MNENERLNAGTVLVGQKESSEATFHVQERPRRTRYLIALASNVQVFSRNSKGKWVRKLAFSDTDILQRSNVSEITAKEFEEATNKNPEKEVKALERKVERDQLRQRQPDEGKLYRGTFNGDECLFSITEDLLLYYSLSDQILRTTIWLPFLIRGDKFRPAKNLETLVVTGQHDLLKIMKTLAGLVKRVRIQIS